VTLTEYMKLVESKPGETLKQTAAMTKPTSVAALSRKASMQNRGQ
jgi:hypothetical protein